MRRREVSSIPEGFVCNAWCPVVAHYWDELQFHQGSAVTGIDTGFRIARIEVQSPMGSSETPALPRTSTLSPDFNPTGVRLERGRRFRLGCRTPCFNPIGFSCNMQRCRPRLAGTCFNPLGFVWSAPSVSGMSTPLMLQPHRGSSVISQSRIGRAGRVELQTHRVRL